MTHDPAIIEAAARALDMEDYNYHDPEDAARLASAIVAAVMPLIEAAALERAAQRIEADAEDYMMRSEVAAAIRSLKEVK